MHSLQTLLSKIFASMYDVILPSYLLIMESLGGDLKWRDRFFAQHAAFAYYWVLVLLWNVSPSLAYNFSELIEAHAVDTYAEFAEANKERLKAIPAPRCKSLAFLGNVWFYFPGGLQI